MTTSTRAPNGHWLPGSSGNRSGRPAVVREIRALARAHGAAAIARLVELSRCKGLVGVAACRALLDRGYGRPEQSVAVTTNDGMSTADLLAFQSTLVRILERHPAALEEVRAEFARMDALDPLATDPLALPAVPAADDDAP